MRTHRGQGRGCEACKRRKIKCGLQAPICAHCAKTQTPCSGPVLGLIILEYNPKHDRTQGAESKRKAIHASTQSLSSSSKASPRISSVPSGPTTIGNLALKFKELVYIPHQRHHSLVASLDDLAASDLPILRRSLSAVSLAMCGISTNNQDLIHESQNLYGATLNALFRQISKNSREIPRDSIVSTKPAYSPINIEIIAVAAVSVWFEGISSTNPYGWIEHSFGSEKLLLTRPPEDYQIGLAHATFRTVRFMMANAGINTIQSTPLALTPWLTTPFFLCPKNPFDHIIDFTLIIPILLSSVDQLIAQGLPNQATEEANVLLKSVLELDGQLKRFWNNLRTERGELYSDIEPDSRHASGHHYQPITRDFQCPSMAECATYFSLCRLMCSLMAACLQTSSPSAFELCRADATTHAAGVLAGVAYADRQSTTGGLREYFGLVCPLLVVELSSPCCDQRGWARRRIKLSANPQRLKGYSALRTGERWVSLGRVWWAAAGQTARSPAEM